MTKLFPIVVALGLAFAFTAPALADTGPNPAPPTMQSTCAKAGMHWDAHQQKCCKDMTTKGHCMM
jgi:hypothetical protein